MLKLLILKVIFLRATVYFIVTVIFFIFATNI